MGASGVPQSPLPKHSTHEKPVHLGRSEGQLASETHSLLQLPEPSQKMPFSHGEPDESSPLVQLPALQLSVVQTVPSSQSLTLSHSTQIPGALQ